MAVGIASSIAERSEFAKSADIHPATAEFRIAVFAVDVATAAIAIARRTTIDQPVAAIPPTE